MFASVTVPSLSSSWTSAPASAMCRMSRTASKPAIPMENGMAVYIWAGLSENVCSR